jgi:prepilin-type N-terminal cleavage/methylation domain-containing protein
MRDGFTLIELLTVIAIIGILAAIIIPTVGKVRQSGQSAKCISNLRQLGLQITLFSNDNKGFLPNLGQATINSNLTDPRIKAPGAKQLAVIFWPYYSPLKLIPNPTPSNHNRHEMLVCPAVDSQFNLASVSLATTALCYIINDRQRIVNSSNQEIYLFGHPSSASSKPFNITQVDKLTFGTAPNQKPASLSSVWSLQDGDRSLLTGGSDSPTGARAAQTQLLASTPAHKTTRNRVYLDGSVKKLTLALSDD